MPDLSHITPDLQALAVPVEGLQPDPANARLHGDPDLTALAGSLRQYGQRIPLVVNRQGSIVLKGNGTLTAARELGWSHLAVVWVEDDPHTAAGYAIADNRTGELAGWNNDQLRTLLDELDTTGLADGLTDMFDDLTALADGLTAAAQTAPATSPETAPAGEQHAPDTDTDQGDDDPPPVPPSTTVPTPSGGDHDSAEPPPVQPPSEYHLLILCDSEDQQKQLFDRFTAAGRDCQLNFAL